MALYKEKVKGNGVKTTYYRIYRINKITNYLCEIYVFEYVDKEIRDKEKENKTFDAYVSDSRYVAEYDESKNIKDYYDYLKTLPEFEGAIDI